MKKMIFVFVLFFSLFIAFASSSASTVWLDDVVLFDQPFGSSSDGGPPTEALGAPDAAGNTGFVSIDIPETLILAFTDNSVLDGIGNDIRIYEYINGDSNIDVYASQNNVDYVYLGRPNGTVEYNINNFAGLDFVNYLKFVGLDNGGVFAGFDLDAVEALNSGEHIVPIFGTLYLLSSGLIAVVGFRKKKKK